MDKRARQGSSIILIPTYNERENVARMIDTVLSLPHAFEVLIIDDNSPDGTAGIVEARMQRHPNRLHLLRRAGKQGLGRAYIAGFEWALQADYEYIFEMDCDFSHPPEKLIELYEACARGGADVAVGSRYVSGGMVKNWPLRRILMSFGASLYVRAITFLPLRDTTAGFVCYRREVLESMDLGAIRFRGYAFQIEMKYTAHALGYKIVEVPITFEDRVLGDSKMSGAIFGEAFTGVWQLRWDKFRGVFPKGIPKRIRQSHK
ncbi:MAG: polyprenol monophosphomannose synthase [Porphyromonadaceae bacterium]|nr:polyprenol monophosphomannose synthase [Porphyromonadaceae bacterium]